MKLEGIKKRIENTVVQAGNIITLEDAFYTLTEVAEILKTSRQYVRKLITAHHIETIGLTTDIAMSKTPRRICCRISKSEVLRLIEMLKL